MKNLCRISVIATPVQAINKLKRADIPVFNCKKHGAYFTFEVSDKYIKKAFAIFAHPCYNVTIKRNSAQKRALHALLARPVLLTGAALFAACTIIANAFVLKVDVTGSGSYLKNEVLAIAYSAGVTPYRIYRGVDEPTFTARVMALPHVTFCSVHKSGSVLYIDVQVQEESGRAANYSPLYSDVNGTVSRIVAVCGTAEVKAGDSVQKGDVLIGAYAVYGDTKTGCMAAGYAQITCTAQLSVFFTEDSEENAQNALSAALFYAEEDEILSREVTAKTVKDGVIYTVDFTYLHTISINFD